MVSVRALILALAVLPSTLAQFDGHGILQVVYNGKTVGCMTTDGMFTTNTTSGSCGDVFGYTDVIPFPYGYKAYQLWLNTTAGYCGPESSTGPMMCDPSIPAFQGWGTQPGTDKNIDLIALAYSDGNDNWNVPDGTPLEDEPKQMVPADFGDRKETGKNYILTWKSTSS